MDTKEEIQKIYREYKALVRAKFGKRIVRLRCDNGGEYIDTKFRRLFKQKRIRVNQPNTRGKGSFHARSRGIGRVLETCDSGCVIPGSSQSSQCDRITEDSQRMKFGKIVDLMFVLCARDVTVYVKLWRVVFVGYALCRTQTEEVCRSA